jgi:hypothetical protein
MNTLVEAAGWTGAALILTAYGASLFRPATASTRVYQAANLLGGLGVAVQSFHAGAMPPAVLNAVWAAAAVVALLRPKSVEEPSTRSREPEVEP